MENEIRNDYIEKALNELIPTFGTREFIDHEKLITLIGSRKVKEALKGIALYLGLPVEINISYVPKGYRPSSSSAFGGFQSTHLVKTDQHNRGVGGITAQVSIPSNLPFYGTPGMVNFPINVRLSEDCAENPATLISVMAHELSHIVLNSMWHKEKENEFYTDLTAMLLGFASIMKTGRKLVKTSSFTDYGTTTTHTETTTYGYLSDENFNFAFNKIEEVLNQQKSAKKELLKKLEHFKKQLSKTKKLPQYFEEYLGYVDKNLHQKISPEDGQKISAFHQAGYTENFDSVIRKNEASLENFFKFIENLKIYTAGNIETMQKYEAQLKSASEELVKHGFLLRKDVDVLKKYIGFFHGLRSIFHYY